MTRSDVASVRMLPTLDLRCEENTSACFRFFIIKQGSESRSCTEHSKREKKGREKKKVSDSAAIDVLPDTLLFIVNLESES